MWIAREKYGLLRLYTKKPVRNYGCWYMEDNASCCYTIDSALFPDLKWEDEPFEVELVSKEYLGLLEEIQNRYEDAKEKLDSFESEHAKELEEEDSNDKKDDTKKENDVYHIGFAKFSIGDEVLIMPSNTVGRIDDIKWDKQYYYHIGESWIPEDKLIIYNPTLSSFSKPLTLVDIKDPKFKPLDRVRTVSGYIGTIIKVYPFYQYDVTKTRYNYDVKLDDSGTFLFNEYELSLYTEPEKERLMPFEKVLVRNTADEVWQANIFNRYICLDNKYVTIDGHQWSYCIPYDGNEKLYNTTHNYEMD